MVDETDRKIIKCLSQNARMSFAELGKIINLSPSSVRERILRMEEDGIIEKYTVILNDQKFGNTIKVFIMVKIFNSNIKSFNLMAKDMKEVQAINIITGNYNVMVTAVLRDHNHLQGFLERLMEYGETVTYLSMSEIL